MRLLGRFLLGLWGFSWAVLASVVVGSIYLLGSPFFSEPAWTDRAQRLFSRAMLVCIGVRIRVLGRDNIPRGTACVMMANHRSYLDIPAVVMGLREISVLFVAKKELVRIPFFGWALAASHHIKVVRTNREQAIAALEESVSKVGEGVGLAVFPEGTRSRTAELLPFKKGGFYVAVDTGLPILPVSIRNSGRLFGKNHRLPRPGVITLVVHPLIPVEGLTREDIPGLMRRTRRALLDGLPEAAARERGVAEGGVVDPGPEAANVEGEPTR